MVYLRFLAKVQLEKINLWRILRSKFPLQIIGITGSYGKTSAMKAIEATLKDGLLVKVSEKANSETGIPLDILGFKMQNYSLLDWLRVSFLAPLALFFNWQESDVYVVEMGVDEPDEPKNMGYLLKIIRPDIGVFLGVTSVHSMQFENKAPSGLKAKQKRNLTLDLIAREKGRLIRSLPPYGWAIINLDDQRVLPFSHKTKARVIGISRDNKGSIRIKEVKTTLNGFSASYEINGKQQRLSLKGMVLPKGYALTFAIALAAARAMEIDIEKAIKSLEKNFNLPPGRSSLIEGIKDSIIIDSSYNSSKKAMLEMLDLLADLKNQSKRKTIAVLGEMRELGEQAKIEHEEIVAPALRVADEIILVGDLMREFFLPKAGVLGFKNIRHFQTSGQAGDYLRKSLKGKELILVKGSQNTIFLEILVERIMKNPKLADQLLCRRGGFWDRKRKPYQ